jgi:hypothetical protein
VAIPVFSPTTDVFATESIVEHENANYDLHLTGANIPDSIGVGDNLRVVARVGEFNPDSLLFFLEPISTQYR